MHGVVFDKTLRLFCEAFLLPLALKWYSDRIELNFIDSKRNCVYYVYLKTAVRRYLDFVTIPRSIFFKFRLGKGADKR